MASPMPRLPPVTSARLPVNSASEKVLIRVFSRDYQAAVSGQTEHPWRPSIDDPSAHNKDASLPLCFCSTGPDGTRWIAPLMRLGGEAGEEQSGGGEQHGGAGEGGVGAGEVGGKTERDRS